MTDKKYRTAADALYGLRDWADKLAKKYDAKNYFFDHYENCQKCEVDKPCPNGCRAQMFDTLAVGRTSAFSRCAHKIDFAIRRLERAA